MDHRIKVSQRRKQKGFEVITIPVDQHFPERQPKRKQKEVSRDSEEITELVIRLKLIKNVFLCIFRTEFSQMIYNAN